MGVFPFFGKRCQVGNRIRITEDFLERGTVIISEVRFKGKRKINWNQDLRCQYTARVDRQNSIMYLI